jgi:hypothetical protein
MSAMPVTRPPLSALGAAQEAIELVGQRLFPFRIERWLPLGFVAFLDSCGRGGGGSGTSFQFPGGTGGDGTGTFGGSDGDFAEARAWFFEHLFLIVAGGLLLLALVVTLVAIVLWINSRGVFMYADNVATGRFDIRRPWVEHGQRAWSYFGWSFGLAMATFAGVLLLLAPIGFFVYLLATEGASCAPIAGVIVTVLLVILFIVVMSLWSVLLRDFAAPLQMVLGVPCGQALGVAWGLVKANPLTFLVYILLKIVFGIVAAITAVLAGCFTCCIGFLPVISHTILQPLLYFERAWSLCLLRQAGYDPFPAPLAPSAPPPPPEPLVV